MTNRPNCDNKHCETQLFNKTLSSEMGAHKIVVFKSTLAEIMFIKLTPENLYTSLPIQFREHTGQIWN